MSKTFLEELCRSKGDTEYTAMTAQLCDASPPKISFQATPDFTSGAPLILITVNSADPSTSGVALEAVADRVPGILSDLQADLGLRPKALIRSTPVVMDLNPDVVRKKQIRAGLLAGVGIFGLGVLGIAIIDALLTKRRSNLKHDDADLEQSTSSTESGKQDQEASEGDPSPVGAEAAGSGPLEKSVEADGSEDVDSDCAEMERNQSEVATPAESVSEGQSAADIDNNDHAPSSSPAGRR